MFFSCLDCGTIRRVITRTICAIGLALFIGAGAAETAAAADEVTDLLARSDVKAAVDAARADEPQVVRDQIRLCQIPAPPFHEGARAQAMKTAFEQAGLS